MPCSAASSQAAATISAVLASRRWATAPTGVVAAGFEAAAVVSITDREFTYRR